MAYFLLKYKVVKKLFLIFLLFICINAYSQEVVEKTALSKTIELISPNLPAFPTTCNTNQLNNLISILIDNVDDVGDNLGELIAFIYSQRNNYRFDFSLSEDLLKSKNPVLIVYFLYNANVITEELYFSEEVLKVILEFSRQIETGLASDKMNLEIEKMDEYELLVFIKNLNDPVLLPDLAKALIDKYGLKTDRTIAELSLTHAMSTLDPSKIIYGLEKHTNILIVDPEEVISKYNLEQITCPRKCSVYFYMGHGCPAGGYISKKYKEKMFYTTATGCELNAKQGRRDAGIMEKYVPGFPPQFWSNGIRGQNPSRGEKGLNPYYNAGYDPMFSLVLKPHKFQETEYQDFVKAENGKTPLLNNWGNYCSSYVTSEYTALQENDISNGTINAVGFMRMVQQVWMASIDKAITLTQSCEACDGVKLEFSYGFHSGEFSAYGQRYAAATTTDLTSDKESLDYKILVLQENISDKELVTLPSKKTVVVPEGYIENLNNEYPINYAKNLKANGSIKFQPIICDESISLESVPDLPQKNELGDYENVITYTITKKNAENILKSECSKFLITNKSI